MDPSLHQRLHSFLTLHGLLGRDRDTHYVVAFSGGGDSTALLHSLTQLREEPGQDIAVTAAYYAHPWRPLHQDVEQVYLTCKKLNVPLVMLTPNLSIPKTEAAAREDRYQQLGKLALSLDATAILTGHHLDDQVETLLFRICRGTGIEGLKGIPALRQLDIPGHTPVTVARPFLEWPRSLLEEHLTAHQLACVEDPTNADTHYKRNFLRHQVLPLLESSFPHIRESLLKLSEVTAGEVHIIDTKMEEVWSDVSLPAIKGLDQVRFTQLSMPFQRRIMRRYLEEAGYEAGFGRVAEVLAFVGGKNRDVSHTGLFSLDKTHFLSIYKNVITIEAQAAEEADALPLEIPGAVSHITLKTTFTITLLTSEQRNRHIDYASLKPTEIFVDLTSLKGQALTVRSRRKGDRIQPLGMKSPIKLKRYLISRGIPRFRRDQLPVLALDSEVLWVVGLGMSERIRVKDRPTHRITIERG